MIRIFAVKGIKIALNCALHFQKSRIRVLAHIMFVFLAWLLPRRFRYVIINRFPSKEAETLFESKSTTTIYARPNQKVIKETLSPARKLKIKKYADAYVNAESGFILTEKSANIQQYWEKGGQHNSDFRSEWLKAQLGNRCFFEFQNIQTEQKGIYLSGFYTMNWYHWIIETLSKSALFEELPNTCKDWPLLVPECILNSPNHLDVFNKVFQSRGFIPLKHGILYLFEQVVTIDSPAMYSPNPLNYEKVGINYQIFVPDLFKRYIQKIKTDISIGIEKNKVFLARSQKSRPYNQYEIEQELAKLGFVTVYCEELSFSEQQKLFLNAEILVGPTGAAWANLIYCREGSKALIWAPDMVSKTSNFTDLANATGVEVVYYFFHSKHSRWVDFMHDLGQVNIDVEEIIERIKNLINDSCN